MACRRFEKGRSTCGGIAAEVVPLSVQAVALLLQCVRHFVSIDRARLLLRVIELLADDCAQGTETDFGAHSPGGKRLKRTLCPA